MPIGAVKWFDNDKGFGFVLSEGDQELFVHASALTPDVSGLRPGDQIEFDIEDSDRGEVATRVRLIHAASDNGDDAKAKRPELAALIDDTIRQLQGLAGSFHQRGSVGPTAAFNTARSLRRLANRLNPPPA